MSFRKLMPVVIVAASVAGLSEAGYNPDAASDKQKAVALANLKKADVQKATTTETDSLIVCSTLPEAKAKALADGMEKAHALGRKVLQFEEKDNPWKGKLTVYYLPEPRAYKNFVRTIAQAKPDDPFFMNLRSDEPYLVESAELTEKGGEADQFGEASAHVVAALLAAKGGTGTEFPGWLKTGLGRAVALQAEGKMSKRYTTYKAAARKLALSRGSVNDVWDGKGKESDLLATSLMEYMAFGPGNAGFLKFVNGFRPSENLPTPSVNDALAAAMWKAEVLDAMWKKWVQSGK